MSLVEKDLSPSPLGSPLTARAARGLDLQVRALSGILSHLACGRMTIVLPDGHVVEYGAPEPGPDATLVIHKWRTLWRTIRRGDMGFAEAFIDGDCSSPDIAKVVEIFVRNEAMLARIGGWAPVRIFNKLFHMRRANTRRGSRRNIIAHYDLGNAFFEQWLDAGMTYSSAIYEEESQSLEAAQTAKQDKILEALALAPGQSVLEVGFGWGGMAQRILERGCRLTGLTLSPSQLAYAARRLDEAGVSPASDLRLQDYRDIRGTFDRIVSVEMLEAVGRAYWPSYFAMIRDRLAAGGQAVLQVITLDESRYEAYRDEVDFIQRYIFPGGMLPTPTIMREQIAGAGLVLKETFTFGQSYAKTLEEWSRRFQSALPRIEAMGFDARFQRLWTYYLAYCEGGFRAGLLDVALYTITRPEAA
jgi:cyclopropane-fatty-acyl-phospholipid synthase